MSEQLSETSRYRRFFSAKPHLSEQSLAYLTDVDHCPVPEILGYCHRA